MVQKLINLIFYDVYGMTFCAPPPIPSLRLLYTGDFLGFLLYDILCTTSHPQSKINVSTCTGS